MLENRLTLHLWNKILGIGVWFFAAIAVTIPIASLIFFALYSEGVDFWHDDKSVPTTAVSPIKSNQGKFDEVSYPSLGSLWIPLPEMADHLVFLKCNDRPDCIKEEKVALIGLKGTNQEKFVKEGDRVYLSCIDQDTMGFSEKPTPFSLQFSLNEEGQMEVSFVTKYMGLNDQNIFESVSHFTLERNEKHRQIEPKEKGLKKMAEAFALAKCYSSDLLFDLYGGEEYTKIKQKYRLKVPKEEGDDYLFIVAGDLITFEEGKWVVSNGKTLGKPLAFVKTIQGKNCELILWGESGISSLDISIPLSLGSPFSTNMHEVFSKLHKRTETSIMCDLAGKHTVVQKGDWFIKTNGKWRSLRHLRDLKDFLGYVLKGELFIFDGIEMRGSSNHFMGHYFNDERTQVVKIDIQLGEKGNKEKSQMKKKKHPLGISSKEGVHKE